MIETLPAPVTSTVAAGNTYGGTSDMHAFPDTSDHTNKGVGTDGKPFVAADDVIAKGWVLWHGQIVTTGPATTNYVQTQTTKGWYYADNDGTVHQTYSGYPGVAAIP